MDSTSADVPVPDYVAELEKPVRGLKIGVAKEYLGEGLDGEVRKAIEAAIQKLASRAARLWKCRCRTPSMRFPTYYIVATAEASSNLARFDGVRYGYRAKDARTLSEMYRRSRDQGFGAEVKRRIMLGTYALSAGYYDAYYLKAQKVRTLLTRDFEEAFKKVDAIVAPVSPTAAFKLGEKVDDPLAMYLADIYTVTADSGGHSRNLRAVRRDEGKTAHRVADPGAAFRREHNLARGAGQRKGGVGFSISLPF